MCEQAVNCVLLADRHHGLTEGVRSLLESTFGAVVMVADETSLFESAQRLKPELAIVDLALVRGVGSLDWMLRLRARSPDMKLIVISVHDEPSVRQSVLAAGADAFVLKRLMATELVPTIDVVLGGKKPAAPEDTASLPPAN